MPDVTVAEKFFTGMSTMDVDGALSGFHDNARYFGVEKVDGIVRRRWYEGTAEIRGYIGNAWIGSVESVKYDILKVATVGETVLIEWFDEAKFVDGTGYTNQGVSVFDFRNGRIVEARTYCDTSPMNNPRILK